MSSTTADITDADERVLPSHLVWAKNYLTAIYSSEPERSAQLFDAFLSPKVVIVANGTEASRVDYIDYMRKNTFIHEGARVTFSGSIDATYQSKDSKPGDWVVIWFPCLLLKVARSSILVLQILFYRVNLWDYSSPSTTLLSLEPPKVPSYLSL